MRWEDERASSQSRGGPSIVDKRAPRTSSAVGEVSFTQYVSKAVMYYVKSFFLNIHLLREDLL